MSKKLTNKTKDNKNKSRTAPISEKKTLIQQQQTYTGPIPPPTLLAEFEKVHTGLADRIMSLAEKDAEHIRKYNENTLLLAKDTQKAETNAICRGQWMSFMLMLLFIVGGFTLIILNKPITGSVFGSVGIIGAIASLVYTFINKRKPTTSKN